MAGKAKVGDVQLDAHYEQAGLVRGMTAAGDSCSPINEFARGVRLWSGVTFLRMTLVTLVTFPKRERAPKIIPRSFVCSLTPLSQGSS